MRFLINKNIFLSATCLITLAIFATSSSTAAPAGRQMIVHRVTELGLEIWTEVEPKWETRLEKKTAGMAPTFMAETPENTYPSTGMIWAAPGDTFSEQEFPVAAKGAVYQAALNYGLSEADAKTLPLKNASYGDLVGYESEFSATAEGTPVDVKVFFGHKPGKSAVAMQVFTLKGKLSHISENIRRSWTHIRYLPK